VVYKNQKFVFFKVTYTLNNNVLTILKLAQLGFMATKSSMCTKFLRSIGPPWCGSLGRTNAVKVCYKNLVCPRKKQTHCLLITNWAFFPLWHEMKAMKAATMYVHRSSDWRSKHPWEDAALIYFISFLLAPGDRDAAWRSEVNYVHT
jgi:hypothetical protein